MKISFIVPFFLIVGVLLFSCKKEEDLKKSKKLAANQQAGIDFLNEGGEVDLGGNSTTTVKQFLEATVDGTRKSYSSFSYSENGLSASMSAFDNSTAISFSLLNLPVSGDVIDLGDQFSGFGSYVPGVGQSFISNVGEMVVDTSTATFLSGSFYFRAKNVQNSNDSVIVTNGKFRIAK